MQRLIVGAVILLSAAACSEQGGDLLGISLPDGSTVVDGATAVDGGSQNDAGHPIDDAGQPPLPQFGITIFEIDGSPAADALVYAVEDFRGRLLGRADANGYFPLEAGAEFLARRGFDQVGQGSFRGDQDQVVTLEAIQDHPETLELREVGLQTEIAPGQFSIIWPQRRGGFVYTEPASNGVAVDQGIRG